MTNDTHSPELEEMRRQLATLQQRLDSQADFTDKQMRKAVKSSVDSLHALGNKGLAVCLLALVLVLSVSFEQGIRPYFLILTFIFLAGNAVSAYFLRMEKRQCSTQADMLATARRVERYKRLNSRHIRIGLPITLLWGAGYVYEVTRAMGMTSVKEIASMGLCALIGGCIGGLIGWTCFHRPAMREADKILAQIEELENL